MSTVLTGITCQIQYQLETTIKDYFLAATTCCYLLQPTISNWLWLGQAVINQATARITCNQ